MSLARRLRWRRGWMLSMALVPVAALVSSTLAAPTTGPDVTMMDLNGTTNWGGTGGLHAYSIGSTACNVGDAPVNWCDNNGGCGSGTTNADHPVISQAIYRLKDGRFEQLGVGWLKHGFASANDPSPSCGNGTCVNPPLGPNQIGVGCIDPYSSDQNGTRPLGRRSEVDATTGAFPFPYGQVTASTLLDQRIQVAESAIDPTLNPTAIVYLEGQYIAPDDAAAGNGLNNASYRRVNVSPTFFLTFAAPTVREVPAIFAWQAEDPAVEMVAVDVPGAIVERFWVARKVSDLGGGALHYEYAVHNLNSARAARGLTITFPAATAITNVGFKDVDHHSGEPYATTDWTPTVGAASVAWAGDTFATSPNANALRWGTLFNFWFDADRGPGGLEHSLELFTPGTPETLVFRMNQIFSDGFESGDAGEWSGAAP